MNICCAPANSAAIHFWSSAADVSVRSDALPSTWSALNTQAAHFNCPCLSTSTPSKASISCPSQPVVACSHQNHVDLSESVSGSCHCPGSAFYPQILHFVLFFARSHRLRHYPDSSEPIISSSIDTKKASSRTTFRLRCYETSSPSTITVPIPIRP